MTPPAFMHVCKIFISKEMDLKMSPLPYLAFHLFLWGLQSKYYNLLPYKKLKGYAAICA